MCCVAELTWQPVALVFCVISAHRHEQGGQVPPVDGSKAEQELSNCLALVHWILMLPWKISAAIAHAPQA